MPSEREKALSRDKAARAGLADDPIYVIKQRRNPRQIPRDGGFVLSERAREARGAGISSAEVEVLRLAADGHTNEEIGEVLFNSKETVKSHIRSILRRLEARDRTHAVAIALRSGLID